MRAGGYVVGLEPSCTAVFRADAAELFPGDQDVLRLRDHVVTIAELLGRAHTGLAAAPAAPGRVLAQVHCHHHAVMGWTADADLLAKTGARAEQLESGCCGLAGQLRFPAWPRADQPGCAPNRPCCPRFVRHRADTVILADGFSCRTQIHELDSGGREAMHLAELLAAASDL